jgi:hypothetical protein
MLLGGFAGAAVLYPVSLLLSTLNLFGWWNGPFIAHVPDFPYILPLLALVFLIAFYVPRKISIFGRIGVSTSGVRLVLPLRADTVECSRVFAVGFDWVDIDNFFFVIRYRLTTGQAERIREFLRIGKFGGRLTLGHFNPKF